MAGFITGALGAGYRGVKKGLGAIRGELVKGKKNYMERMAGAEGIWKDRGGDAEAATPVLSDREFMRDFKVGDKNQVAALQQRLVDAGYDIGSSGPGGQGIDAMFGGKTEAAYRDWASGVMEAEGEEAYRYGEEAPEEAPVEIEDVLMEEFNKEPIDFSRLDPRPGPLPEFESRSRDIERRVQASAFRNRAKDLANQRFRNRMGVQTDPLDPDISGFPYSGRASYRGPNK